MRYAIECSSYIDIILYLMKKWMKRSFIDEIKEQKIMLNSNSKQRLENIIETN